MLLAIALAAALALAAATQPWVVVSFTEGSAAFDWLELTGQQLNPSLSPIALAGLAAALALTIAGPVFRRVLGALVLLLGAGLAALGVFSLIDPRGGVSWSVSEVTGITGDAQYGVIRDVTATSWPSAAVAAGAVIALLGVAVLLLGGRWKAGGRRFRSDERPPAPESGREPDRISDWDALSGGDDPTRSQE
nr:Trp biosynthesis-associated membrane protein [Leucobacter weissii]